MESFANQIHFVFHKNQFDWPVFHPLSDGQSVVMATNGSASSLGVKLLTGQPITVVTASWSDELVSGQSAAVMTECLLGNHLFTDQSFPSMSRV